MELKIADISNVNLQKLAQNVDDGNGILVQEEIGELLIKMVKKNYEYEDFKSLLGLELNNMSVNEQKEFYANCINKLEGSLKIAENMVGRQADEEKQKQDQKTLVGAAATIGTMGSTYFLIKNGVVTATKLALRAVTGLAVGTGVGIALAAGAVAADRIITKNLEKDIETKSNFIKNLEQDLVKLN